MGKKHEVYIGGEKIQEGKIYCHRNGKVCEVGDKVPFDDYKDDSYYEAKKGITKETSEQIRMTSEQIQAGIDKLVCSFGVPKDKVHRLASEVLTLSGNVEHQKEQIKAFQKAHKLKETGIIGKETYWEIYAQSRGIHYILETNKNTGKIESRFSYELQAKLDSGFIPSMDLQIFQDFLENGATCSANYDALVGFLALFQKKYSANPDFEGLYGKFFRKFNSTWQNKVITYKDNPAIDPNNPEYQDAYTELKLFAKNGDVKHLKNALTNPTLLLAGGIMYLFGVFKTNQSFLQRAGWLLGIAIGGPAVYNALGGDKILEDISNGIKTGGNVASEGSQSPDAQAGKTAVNKAPEKIATFFTATIPNWINKEIFKKEKGGWNDLYDNTTKAMSEQWGKVEKFFNKEVEEFKNSQLIYQTLTQDEKFTKTKIETLNQNPGSILSYTNFDNYKVVGEDKYNINGTIVTKAEIEKVVKTLLANNKTNSYIYMGDMFYTRSIFSKIFNEIGHFTKLEIPGEYKPQVDKIKNPDLKMEVENVLMDVVINRNPVEKANALKEILKTYEVDKNRVDHKKLKLDSDDIAIVEGIASSYFVKDLVEKSNTLEDFAREYRKFYEGEGVEERLADDIWKFVEKKYPDVNELLKTGKPFEWYFTEFDSGASGVNELKEIKASFEKMGNPNLINLCNTKYNELMIDIYTKFDEEFKKISPTNRPEDIYMFIEKILRLDQETINNMSSKDLEEQLEAEFKGRFIDGLFTYVGTTELDGEEKNIVLIFNNIKNNLTAKLKIINRN